APDVASWSGTLAPLSGANTREASAGGCARGSEVRGPSAGRLAVEHGRRAATDGGAEAGRRAGVAPAAAGQVVRPHVRAGLDLVEREHREGASLAGRAHAPAVQRQERGASV